MRLLKLKDSLAFNFAALLGGIFLLHGRPVPNLNEYLYLLLPVKQWDASFLLNDWTLSMPWNSHRVFNATVGLLTLVLPLEIVGWAGRIACWTFITLALFRIGRRFEIPLWTITLCVFLWLLRSQAVVAGEWIIGSFEAKTVAYVFLLWAVERFLQQKEKRAAVLLGLAFSFHPVVGFWGGLAVGCALLAMKIRLKTLATVAGLTVFCALPGAIPLLMTMSEGGGGAPTDLQFYVMTSMPFHLDPFSWRARRILILYALLLLVWLFSLKDRGRRDLQFLATMQLALGGFFTLGLLARWMESYPLLLSMPCRLAPVLTPLLFLFHAARMYRHHTTTRLRPLVLVAAALALMTLHPLGFFKNRTRATFQSWRQPDDDAQIAFKWLAANTPNGTVVISPPWRRDAFYLSRRAQIANWNAPAVDRLGEWRERIEAMTGRSRKRTGLEPPVVSIPRIQWAYAMLEREYSRMTEEDIRVIVESYGGQYLVSVAPYGFPVAFAAGDYKVYSLPKK